MENNTSALTKLGRGWMNIERFILIAASLLCAGIVAVGVFTRYVLHVDFYGQEELITLIATWLYWIGGTYASYENSHIQADVLSTMLKNPKVLFILKIITFVISIVVCAVLTMWSFKYSMDAFRINSITSGLKIPMVTSQIALFVGFTLMLIHTLINLIKILKGGVKAVEEEVKARKEAE